MSRNLWLCVLLVMVLTPNTRAENTPRSLAVLTSTDISELNLGEALQSGLGQLLNESGLFAVQYAQFQLSGFTPVDIRLAHQSTGTEVLAFTYMEKQRISVFLFDSNFPQRYIVSSESLENPSGGKLSSPFIEERFRMSVNTVMKDYVAKRYQFLPGANVSADALAEAEERDARLRSEKAKMLFRELSSLEDGKTYMGLNIGMARFASASASASTVDFGGILGYSVVSRVSAELGADIFSYAQAHIDLRYRIPLAEKYVSTSVSLGTGYILGVVSENRGFSSTDIEPGSVRFGPGFGLDIPLLGAHLRADLRYYIAGGSVFLGTYGILYHI